LAASLFLGLGLLAQTNAQTAHDSGRQPPVLTPELAAETFDQLWGAFDQRYAMFVIHPEVDWVILRDQYRPKALASRSPNQLAKVCANMLKNLRDQQVWVTVAKESAAVFNPPQPRNANPMACQAILGGLKEQGRVVWDLHRQRHRTELRRRSTQSAPGCRRASSRPCSNFRPSMAITVPVTGLSAGGLPQPG
jgi:hypothetical protein